MINNLVEMLFKTDLPPVTIAAFPRFPFFLLSRRFSLSLSDIILSSSLSLSRSLCPFSPWFILDHK